MAELIKGASFDDCPDVHCEHCRGIYFLEARRFKRMSSLVTKSGQDELAPIQIFICTNCGREVDFAAEP